jgi:hypothetical protein
MTDWKSIVKTVAPAISSALGGPLAGAAVSALSTAILGNPTASESQIERVILNGLSPDALAAMKKADQDFMVEMQRVNGDIEKAYLLDVQDARRSHGNDDRLYKLAYGMIGTFVAIMIVTLWGGYEILTGDTKIESSTLAVISGIVGAVVGYVASNTQQVVGYFFGSSSGSDKKTDAITEAIRKIGN